jgi:putative FmdB family regulatory protein
MPTYEYECRCCNHQFEAEQSIKDKPLTDCPKCKVNALKRLISSGTGFVLRGEGWYKDGYASKGNSGGEGV